MKERSDPFHFAFSFTFALPSAPSLSILAAYRIHFIFYSFPNSSLETRWRSRIFVCSSSSFCGYRENVSLLMYSPAQKERNCKTAKSRSKKHTCSFDDLFLLFLLSFSSSLIVDLIGIEKKGNG